MTIFEKNFKLLKPILDRLEYAYYKDKDYMCLSTEGFMDLHVDILYREPILRIAMAHNYIQNGDVCPDPDMEIEIHRGREMAVAKTFQDIYHYECYDDLDDIAHNQKKYNDLQSFLNQWLCNLHEQGHFTPYVMTICGPDGNGVVSFIAYTEPDSIQRYLDVQKEYSELCTFVYTRNNQPITRGEPMKTDGLTQQEAQDLQNLLTQLDMVARSYCVLTQTESSVKQETISEKTRPWNPKVSAKYKMFEDKFEKGVNKGNYKNAINMLKDIAKFAHENIPVMKGDEPMPETEVTEAPAIEVNTEPELPKTAVIDVIKSPDIRKAEAEAIAKEKAEQPQTPQPGGDVPVSQMKAMLDTLMKQNQELMAALQNAQKATPKVSVVNTKTVTKNDKFKSIEIRFDGKPDDDVIAQLKEENWRFYNFRSTGDKFWSNRDTERNEKFANELEVRIENQSQYQ